jgi:pSer/pThr/pTyr-binding forkhead associated (FHA) protein
MQQRETAAIPKLVLSTAHRLLRRIAIDRPRLTIGRRPYNDVMLDDLTVSGEHAVLHTENGGSTIHDLHSRNGTLVNGVPVSQRMLVDGDRIEIGIYRLHYVLERAPAEAIEPPPMDPDTVARLVMLAGPQAGSTVRMERPIVSVSNGSGQVAVIARRRAGFVLTHLEGPTYPLVNGEPIGLVAHPLKQDDLIELAGTIFQFHSDPPP